MRSDSSNFLSKRQRTIKLNSGIVKALHDSFPTNYISTTKYTLYSYLPHCLFNQLRRVANFYFLLITILQSIPAVSPLSPETAILPLAFVIGISMVREAYEDYQRYKSDNETNKAPVFVLKDNQFKSIRSDEV